jgi:hypothetical protein
LGHVYVTVTGFAKRIIPIRSPVEFSITNGTGMRVVLTHTTPLAVRQVAPDTPVDHGAGADPVADVVAGPELAEWWLDAGVYRIPLPVGWTAITTGEVTPAFDLVQDPERSVFIQTAVRRPATLIAPGQRVVSHGMDDRSEWVEVSYRRDGVAWLQRHALLRSPVPALITAQAPAAAFAEARALHEVLVRRVIFAIPAT